MEQEIAVLRRTEAVLQNLARETAREVRAFEARHGVSGLLGAEDDLEDLARRKGQTDLLKGKTLEELTALVETLRNKIEEKRERLKPLIEEHKALKAALKETEEETKRKRAEYERVT